MSRSSKVHFPFAKVCIYLPFLAVLLLFGSVHASAQSALVSGTIRDPDRPVVSNASVTLINVRSGVTLQTTTNQAGEYTFPSVDPGTYRLEAHKAGFGPVIMPSLAIAAGQNVSQNASFTVAGASTSVTVNGL
jgi:iron complex outermembrane recepter protein